MKRHFDKCGVDASMSDVVKILGREKGDKILYKDPRVVPIYYNIKVTMFIYFFVSKAYSSYSSQ